MRSLVKIKSLRNSETTLSFSDVGKSCSSPQFLTLQTCIITLFCENKILAEISEFTVRHFTCNDMLTSLL